MKKFLQITLFIISCVAISSFTTIVIFRFIPKIKKSFDPIGSLDTFIFILTLIVAVLAFMFAFIGYHEFTRVIKYTQKVDRLSVEFNENNESFNQIRNRLTQQELFLTQSINFLSTIIARLAHKTQDKDILEKHSHYSHISQLYRISIDTNETPEIMKNKFDAFAYFEVNGTNDDIPYLEYVAQHDPNEQYRNRAWVIIGGIKERNKKHYE